MQVNELMNLIETPQQLELVAALVRQQMTGSSTVDYGLLDGKFLLDSAKQIIDFFEKQKTQGGASWDVLTKILASVVMVDLRVSIIPSSSLWRLMVTQIKREVGPQAVVSIEVDPSLVGGVTVACEGRFGDYSLAGMWGEN